MWALVAVLTYLFLWKHGTKAESCDTAYSQTNQKIQGHVIGNYSANTSDQCINKCAKQADCHSINYYYSQGICELNNANHLTNPESLVYSAGSQYLNYFLKPPSKCSRRLCSYPLVCVIDKNNGQKYECASCEELGVKEVISFPRKAIEDKVVYEITTDIQLTAFTISMWVQADPSTNFHTPFSYATVTQPNEISICLDRSYTELGIVNDFERSYPPVIDGKWHHLCATWQNSDGAYKFYIDGVKQRNSNTTMHRGHVIQKGALVLGQEQDSYKGEFELSQSLQGNLSSVNMWDRVLMAQEVSALARKCPTEEGNVITWSTLKSNISSGLKLICTYQCV